MGFVGERWKLLTCAAHEMKEFGEKKKNNTEIGLMTRVHADTVSVEKIREESKAVMCSCTHN